MSDLKRETTHESSSHSLDQEKGGHAETAEALLAQYDPKEIERIWKKVDWHVMPVAMMLYLASYIDRYVPFDVFLVVMLTCHFSANIGNAKVLGLQKSLQLTNNQYNLALSIFFVGYVIYETPSNILLKKISPRWYIPAMTVSISLP